MFTVGVALLIGGAVIVMVEVHTLTIYLIALAVACFAAGGLALTAHTGPDTTLAAFALVLFAGLPVAHFARRRLRTQDSERVSHDDVGALVTVITVRSDGRLRVTYRGAEWDARPATGVMIDGLAPGTPLVIAARDGNTLLLAPGSASATAHDESALR